MNRKIFGGIALVMIVAAMVLNVNFSARNNNLSDISSANVEALAKQEVGYPNDKKNSFKGEYSCCSPWKGSDCSLKTDC